MKPKELQKLLGINADRIKFYKKQNVFIPENPTNGNQATNYTESDYRALQTLEILTKSGFTVGDIKKMQDSKMTLADVARNRKKEIHAELQRKQNALHMLSNMIEAGVEFESLNIDYYWNVINDRESNGEEFIDIMDAYEYYAVACPNCGCISHVDLKEYVNDTSSDETENGMGPDVIYWIDSDESYECPKCGKIIRIEGWVREYPVGAHDSESITIELIQTDKG